MIHKPKATTESINCIFKKNPTKVFKIMQQITKHFASFTKKNKSFSLGNIFTKFIDRYCVTVTHIFQLNNCILQFAFQQVVWCGRIASTPKNQPTKSTRTTGTGNNAPDVV